MPYAQLDDGFHDDPEILALGHAGAGVIAKAYSYCARHLTDGVLARSWLNSVAKSELKRRLIQSGLVVELGGDYLLRDYLKHNPTKGEVERRRELARQRKARQRESGEIEAVKAFTDVTESVTRDSTREDWSGDIEGLSSSSSEGRRARKRDLLWEALDPAFGPVTNDVQRGRRNRALAAIRQSLNGMTGEEAAAEVARRAQVCKALFSLGGEMALAAHWDECGGEVVQ